MTAQESVAIGPDPSESPESGNKMTRFQAKPASKAQKIPP